MSVNFTSFNCARLFSGSGRNPDKRHGYAVCYGYILVSMAKERECQVVAFHINSRKWHKVRVSISKEYNYPFWGRAVVVDNIIYTMSCNLGHVLTFSSWWDSDESSSTGRRHYLGTPKSLILSAQAYPPSMLLGWRSQKLVHFGRRDFCLVQTCRSEHAYMHTLEYQYLCVTTFRIVGQGREMDIETLRSAVYRVAIEGRGDDIEPKEEDYCATTKLTESESESAARNLQLVKEDFFSFPTGPKLGLEAFCTSCS
ncbi:hypothetical protein M0R45_038082 [Rubus argutus]|uniref:Uncharacterized protein n=1 Tax=Rubus argutus TaxID=59490 RepID=A0AAW1W2C5_RUBAR